MTDRISAETLDDDQTITVVVSAREHRMLIIALDRLVHALRVDDLPQAYEYARLRDELADVQMQDPSSAGLHYLKPPT